MREQTARAQHAADIGDHEDEEGGDDAEVEFLVGAEALEHLDTLLEVDEGDVEAEDVTREAGDIAEEVAGVGDGKDPVEDEGPSARWSAWETPEAAVLGGTRIPIQHMKAM